VGEVNPNRQRMLISRRAIAALTVVLAFSATPALAAQRPSLRIVRSWPLSLHATGFHPGESVKVTVHMGSGHWSRHARADAAGAFSTRFAGLRLRSCARPLNISAHGAKGDFARALIPPRECAPD
jgi:hypothetical protein